MWCWVDDDRVAVVAKSGQLVLVPIGGGRTQVVVRDGRSSAPVADGAGRLLFALGRDDALRRRRGGRSTRGRGRSGGRSADFAWDPDISLDGRWVAWHEWDLAAMSWTTSRIVVVDRHEGVPRVVAGGPGEVTACRSASPGSRRTVALLAYVSDAIGLVERRRVAVPTVPSRGHCCGNPTITRSRRGVRGNVRSRGRRTSDAIALCRNEAGFARLVAVTSDGDVTELAKGWHHSIDWGRPGIVAVRSGARTPPQVTVFDPGTGERTGRGAWGPPRDRGRRT